MKSAIFCGILTILGCLTGVQGQNIDSLQDILCDKIVYTNNFKLEEVKSFFEKGVAVDCNCHYTNTVKYSKGHQVAQAFVFAIVPVGRPKASRTFSYFISPMEAAVRHQRGDLIEYLRSKGETLNEGNHSGENYLTEAMRELNFSSNKERYGYSRLNFLLKHGADPALADFKWVSDQGTIKYMVGKGANIQTVNIDDFIKSRTQLKWLLDNGYDMSRAEPGRFNLEWIMASRSRLTYYLDLGLNPDINRLTFMAHKEEDWATIDYLLERGADPNMEDTYKVTLLTYATLKGDLDRVNKLVSQGAYYERRFLSYHHTLLTSAARSNSVPMVRYFLSLGLDPNAPYSFEKDYPLSIAFKKENEEMIKVLVQAGARMSTVIGYPYNYEYFAEKDPGHATLKKWFSWGLKLEDLHHFSGNFLHEAISERDTSMVEVLLQFTDDVNIRGRNGATPLYNACAVNWQEVAYELLAMGADPTLEAKWYHKTAVSHAVDMENYVLVDSLLTHGAQLKGRNRFDDPYEDLFEKPIPEYQKVLAKHGIWPTEDLMEQRYNDFDKEDAQYLLDYGYVPPDATFAFPFIDTKDEALIRKMVANGYDLKSMEKAPNYRYYTAASYAKMKGLSKELVHFLTPSKPEKKKKKRKKR